MRSVEWHEIYDPATDKYQILDGMRGSTGTQPFVGQRDHMGVAVVDGKIHAIAGRMDPTTSTPLHAVYDPKTDGWIPRTAADRAQQRLGRTTATASSYSAARRPERFGTNEARPKTDKWERSPDEAAAPRPARRDGRGDRRHGTCRAAARCRAAASRAPIDAFTLASRHAMAD